MSRPFPYFMAFVGMALCFVTTAFCLTQALLVPSNRPVAPRGQPVLTANDAAIDALLKKPTLEEKIKMVHANSAFASGGIAHLGIPELITSDGPHGVRPE